MAKDRQALEPKNELIFDGRKYRIIEVMSENGGSCLVYKAKRLPSESQPANFPGTKAVIKEFYPKVGGLARFVSRGENSELIVSERGQEQFSKEKERFIGGVAKQVAFYDDDSNHAMMGYPEVIDNVNGTVYSVLGLTNGIILGDKDFERSALTVYEIAQIMTSLCNAINKLHVKNKLYLDIKPNNILLFNGENGESRRVALFDFDTVFDKDKLPAVGFGSQGWAPDEQMLWEIKEITEASDVYSIGALFYWLLIGDKVPDELSTQILRNDFSFLDDCVLIRNTKNAKAMAKKLLRATLNKDRKERAQSAGVLV